MAKVSLAILLTLGITALTSGEGTSGTIEHGGGLSSEGGVGLIGLGGLGGVESSYGIGQGGHHHQTGGGQGSYGGASGHGEAQEDAGWGWNQEAYAHPKYAYSYGVKDKMDQKQASEWRDGKTVQGSYSLMEPDGSWRTVNYYDDGHGFNAMVHHTPVNHKGQGY